MGRIAAFGAIEMALWDIRGKAWKQPLYQLLGGAVRKDIPFTDYFSLRGDGPILAGLPAVRGEKTPRKWRTTASCCTRPAAPRSSRASSELQTRPSRCACWN